MQDKNKYLQKSIVLHWFGAGLYHTNVGLTHKSKNATCVKQMVHTKYRSFFRYSNKPKNQDSM